MQASLTFQAQFKVSSQLVLASQVLQIPEIDIEPFLLDEMRKNPALEFASPERVSAYTLGRGRLEDSAVFVPDDYDPLLNVAQGLTAVDQLMAQARLQLPTALHEVALFLLHSLDEHGYLKTTSSELALEFGCPPADIDTVINVLQQLHPPGIAARNLQECLLIQCSHLEATGMDCQIIRRLLEQAWDDLCRCRWQAIARRLSISIQELAAAQQRIAHHFYPYPLLLLEDSQTTKTTARFADLVIQRNEVDKEEPYSLRLPGAEAFELRISRSFQSLLQGDRGLSVADGDWVKTAVIQARLLIKAVNQRWDTLRRIGEYLVVYQQDFLEKGDLHLQPLTHTAVANAIDLHESTISRGVQDKIAQLPNGRFVPLSHFFDHTLAIKDSMQRILSTSDQALSDQDIANALEAKGICLARRTVAKYRKQLNISPQYLRKRQAIITNIE